MRVDLDIPVHCVDGGFGDLADVVIDPSTRRLTHLVIRPKHGDGRARLVPIDNLDGRDRSTGIYLVCTIEQLADSNPIEESAYLPAGEYPTGERDWDVGIQEMHPLPESGSLGNQGLPAGIASDYDQHVAVSYHRVPKGEVEIRRHSRVTSSDGDHVGHVVGFVVDDQDRILDLILEHGHLWGKRRVAVPGSAIQRLETDGVTVSLSRDAIGELRPLRHASDSP